MATAKAAKDLRRGLVKFSPMHDSSRRYLTDAPTPERFASLLKDVDDGDIAAIVEMNEEMEAKDAHLQGVANTRRNALTALEWSIEPDTADKDSEGAGEAADYVTETFADIRSWPDTLQHLASAIGPGIALTELIWEKSRLVHTTDVPGHRLIGDTFVSQQVNVLTDDEPVDGIPTDGFAKFVVHTPNSRAGFPMRVTITRAQAYCFIIKHFGIADWAAWSEMFGMPWRIAKFTGEATPGEKTEVQSMLENMGSDGWAMFSDAVEIQLLKGDAGTPPYSDLVDWVEKKQSILYLGQTLSTDVGPVGSFAAAKVHDNVRVDILIADIQDEKQMVREQIIRPMVEMRWPNGKRPLPHFVRRVIEAKNLDEERLNIEKLKFMAERGLRVDANVIYEMLGIPRPKDLSTPDVE
ncbi:hypothetical protein LCGC14_1152670 [marine sediment metagenome]|uniref:DUF935 family protein n=1 Tax=marine sediment metagenome TaxID=412755 RepID=A0A0F9LUZ3_9ZZZZ